MTSLSLSLSAVKQNILVILGCPVSSVSVSVSFSVLALMGANLSSTFTDPNTSYSMYGSLFFHHPSLSPPPQHERPSLGDLPESCVALILKNLAATDVCKLARLNRAFRAASWADFVWESKLPLNYEILIERLLLCGGGDCDFEGKKLGLREIYTMLCKANPFGGDTKVAWLDKNSGGVCLSISSKGLGITGIDDRRYWNYIPCEESRYNSVAYLQQIWWFEADGQLEFPFPPGTYSLFFRLLLGRTARRFGRRICNTEHIHGWDKKPVQFQLWTSGGQHASSQCFLDDPGKWNLYHVGDFVVDSHCLSTKLKFSMKQIDCTHTKGGLCLDSVLVYPCKYKEKLKAF